MKAIRRWTLSVVHNCLVHPLLPVGELLDAAGLKLTAGLIYKAHDLTVPED